MPPVRRPPRASQDRQLAVALHDLVWLLPRTLDRQVEAALDDLPASELEVMRLLVRRPGLSVGAVAQELGLRQSNTSAAVRSLLARGLLERREDERDGRVARLHPTRRAIDVRGRREAAWAEALAATLATLPPDTARALRGSAGALGELADALSERDAE